MGGENYVFPEKYVNSDNNHAKNLNVIYSNSMINELPTILKIALRPLKNKLRFDYLKNNFRKIRANIIHAHFAHVGWEAIKLKDALKLPLVVSFYGYDYQSVPFKYPIWKKRYKALFEKVDIIICEGYHGKKILLDMGCDESKIEVCKLGIEVKKIAVNKPNKSKNSLKMIQIANMVDKKGHIHTLLAFADALKSCPNMHLTLIGNGKNRPKIMQFLEMNNLKENISVINDISYASLHNFLDDYNVFIHPSCYTDDMDCEGGAPIVLLDAQATGLPIISTKHCDIPDEVSHKKSGFLADEKNNEQLSKYIKKFYRMSSLEYIAFSKNARNHIEKNYDISNNRKIFDSLYGKLLIGFT